MWHGSIGSIGRGASRDLSRTVHVCKSKRVNINKQAINIPFVLCLGRLCLLEVGARVGKGKEEGRRLFLLSVVQYL